jgi:hypothetical protein
MKFTRIYFLVAIVWLFQSCFDSDDHIFDEADATDIKVDATLARSASPILNSVKADTFNINDTIYFQTKIVPNKIIRVQDYHWLMNGQHCSSEYNFKKQLAEPGYYKFTFILKDYFGDMHYDSLEVWIADKPVLNDTLFIPATGTQAIDPYESIYFSWEAATEGIRLAHRFRFTLSEEEFANSDSKFKSIDTIISEPHFIFHNELNPLKKYNWTVQAFNEYNFASSEKIESFFFTKGLPGEGSLLATIKISQQSSIPVQLSLQDVENEDRTFKYSLSISQSRNEISLGAVPAGKYKLTIRSDYSDFGTTKKDITIRDGFVTILDNIKLVDSIAPSIESVLNLDTLDFSDTLKFIITDKGSTLNSQSIVVNLEADLITDRFYKDSILTVVLKDTDKSWAYRILTISATDGSNNKKTKSFYITPSTFWFTTNSDTTIDSDKSILLFIDEHNPFNFKVEAFSFYNVTRSEAIASVTKPEKSVYSTNIDASIFDKEQTIRTTVIYTNGIVQNKTWKLTVNDVEPKEEN